MNNIQNKSAQTIADALIVLYAERSSKNISQTSAILIETSLWKVAHDIGVVQELSDIISNS